MSSTKTAVPKCAALALHEIERGMALRKCRKCGCMKEALDTASRTFRSAEESEIRQLLPAVEQGLLTQLDHAAYLGRELAKAEIALKTGSHYEQDAALGILPSKQSQSTEMCEDLACSCHGA
jgi:hypothetical protein